MIETDLKPCDHSENTEIDYKDKNVKSDNSSQPCEISPWKMTKIKTESDKPLDFNIKYLVCTYEGCTSSFTKRWKLNNHILSHTGQHKIYSCHWEECDKSYSSSSHLKRHIAVSHATDNLVPKQTYPCSEPGCDKVLKTHDILVKHTKRFHSEKRFKCQVCSVAFRSQEMLNTHSVNRHHGRSSHRCAKCNISFSHLGKYNRHMRGHSLHFCQSPCCYFSTENYTELRRHNSICHPKRLLCATCSKTFSDKALLKRHVRVHLIEQGLYQHKKQYQPVICHLCNITLATKGSLKRHLIKIHQNPNTERAPPKKGKDRQRRKDVGKYRRSKASTLSAVHLPPSIDQKLIQKTEYSNDDPISIQLLKLVLQNALPSDPYLEST